MDKINILHLSDLHFTGDTTEPSRWFGPLKDDLNTNFKCEKLDVLIISGDITRFAEEKEYNQAEEFLSLLTSKFAISQKNIIIVPGNHDVNWPIGEEAYKLTIKDGKPVEELDEKKHKERFRPFADFFGRVTGRYFDLEYENQAIVWDLEELDLLILGLNSAWKLDKRNTKNANINLKALRNAFDKIDEIVGKERRLKFAVWHHPLISSEEGFIGNTDFLQQLRRYCHPHGFKIALHGHIKSEAGAFRPMRDKFEIIAAGTFSAGVTRQPLMQGLQETNLSESFHVFLSHNSQDKPIVRKLAQALKLYDLRVWLDEEQLVPGRPWQEALETIIQTTQAVAVLIGQSGLGPWENSEMRACLSEFVDRKLPVIPVLLPGTLAAPKLPPFLKIVTWVDLRDGLSDPGLEKLVWGITGDKPAKPPRIEGGGLQPFGAQTKELNTGHFWQYNLLQIYQEDHKRGNEPDDLISEDDLIVNTRQRCQQDGGWMGDVIWDQDSKPPGRGWYPIRAVFPKIKSPSINKGSLGI